LQGSRARGSRASFDRGDPRRRGAAERRDRGGGRTTAGGVGVTQPPVRLLRDLAEINPRAARLAPDEIVSFVGMADLDEVAARNTSEAPRRFEEVSKGYTPFQNGDLLAAKITPCWQNGKVGQAVLSSEHGMGS